MANRSYLYAAATDPSLYGATRPRGLNEANTCVPLVHKLLASENAKVVPSLIWEGLAIVGDFEGGVRRASVVFEALAERGSSTAASVLLQMTSFLADVKQRGFVLLEVIEIGELSGDDPIVGPKVLLAEIESLRERVDAGIDAELAGELSAALEQEDQGWWSEYLYFSFCHDLDDDVDPFDEDDIDFEAITSIFCSADQGDIPRKLSS